MGSGEMVPKDQFTIQKLFENTQQSHTSTIDRSWYSSKSSSATCIRCFQIAESSGRKGPEETRAFCCTILLTLSPRQNSVKISYIVTRQTNIFFQTIWLYWNKKWRNWKLIGRHIFLILLLYGQITNVRQHFLLHAGAIFSACTCVPKTWKREIRDIFKPV